jgi:hypothetical protein
MRSRKFKIFLFHLFVYSTLWHCCAFAGSVGLSDSVDSFSDFLSKGRAGTTDVGWGIVVNYNYMERFGRFSEGGAVHHISDDDIVGLFRTTYISGFYYPSDSVGDAIWLYLFEMKRRGIDKDYYYSEAFSYYVKSRDFSRANKLAHIHHVDGMEGLPKIVLSPVKANRFIVWKYLKSADQIERSSIDLRGRHIVVVAHPLCHFTVNAVSAIESDVVLRNAFVGSVWVSPPNEKIQMDVFSKWNRLHPIESMSVVDKVGEWPIFDVWATPTFYFVKDAKVIDVISGWPPAGGLDNFERKLESW